MVSLHVYPQFSYSSNWYLSFFSTENLSDTNGARYTGPFRRGLHIDATSITDIPPGTCLIHCLFCEFCFCFCF